MKYCRQVYEDSSEDFNKWGLFCENSVFGQLPQELYEHVCSYLLNDGDKKCNLSESLKCNACEEFICEPHMDRWTCISCKVGLLCANCYKKYHSGHARWSDVEYEL